jgi:hypothetical protein
MKTMRKLLFLTVVIFCSYHVSAQNETVSEVPNRETEILIDGKLFGRYPSDSLSAHNLTIPVMRGVHNISFIFNGVNADPKIASANNILTGNVGFKPRAQPALELLAGISLIGQLIQMNYSRNSVVTFE